MGANAAELLADYPVVIEVPVWWGDQDAFGHVNNTVFFRWFESARIAYTGQLGLAELYRTRRIGPILAAVGCNFRRQVKYPDTVHVGARIDRIGRTSLTMAHAVASQAHAAIAGDGTSTIVVFDYDANAPHPIPDDLRAGDRNDRGPDSGLTRSDSAMSRRHKSRAQDVR